MLIRIVKMTFRENAIEEFQALFDQYKNDIAGQPGCTHLDLLQDIKVPSIFMTYSHWESEEALNAYRSSETFGVVWPATKKLFGAKPEAWSVIEKRKVK